MAVLIRSRSPLNPQGTLVLQATLRRRACCRCKRGVHVTLFSPSTFIGDNLRAGLLKAFAGQECEPSDGQCCIRCTRALRS
jgi:hypothetical protein